jgi:hypothetical protein
MIRPFPLWASILFWALILGTALFAGGLVSVGRLTDQTAAIAAGSMFLIFFLAQLGRAFLGPAIAYNSSPRRALLLSSVPLGLFSLAAFFEAWPRTAPYAFLPAGIATTFYLALSVTRLGRYIKDRSRQLTPPD